MKRKKIIYLLIIILIITLIKGDNYIVENVKIDLNQEIQDDIGILIIKGTKIKYTVMQYSDNEYYLNHDNNGNPSKSGWIFLDYRNNKNFNNKNNIIYGHARISDGSMFGSLYNVLSSTWQNNSDNYNIIIKRKNSELLYHVFSTYVSDLETYYLKIDFKNEDEYDEFINTLKSRSNYKYDGIPERVNNILTLSTCYKNNKRLVLHAYLLNNVY